MKNPTPEKTEELLSFIAEYIDRPFLTSTEILGAICNHPTMRSAMSTFAPMPSDPKPTSDLLSRLAEAQRYVNARGWYGLDVLLNEAETAIRRLEQAKGGDADERSSNNARHATSPGVTAGASEIEELCRRLNKLTVCRRCECSDCQDGYENHSHACTNGPNCVETKERWAVWRFHVLEVANAAAALIRRLELQPKDTPDGK